MISSLASPVAQRQQLKSHRSAFCVLAPRIMEAHPHRTKTPNSFPFVLSHRSKRQTAGRGFESRCTKWEMWRPTASSLAPMLSGALTCLPGFSSTSFTSSAPNIQQGCLPPTIVDHLLLELQPRYDAIGSTCDYQTDLWAPGMVQVHELD